MTNNSIASLKTALAKELGKESLDFQAIAELNNKLLECDKSAVRFSIDARHIHRLGFELVGRQETALGELIKNAYDADATTVTIVFANYSSAGGSLTISDDGSGMTETTIRNAWMKLSTSEKERAPISERYRRSRAGRKGIGRFAVERLGSTLTLSSRVAGESEGVLVTFDWDESLKPDLDIALVAFSIERFEKPIDDHGTTLEIGNLRDKWTDKQLEQVWKSVILLQPPFKPPRTYRGQSAMPAGASEPDPGFSVVINGKSSDKVRAEFSLNKTFLEQRTARITGSVDENGYGMVTIKSTKLGVDDSTTLDTQFLALGELSFEADYFNYAPELISGFSVATARDLGAQYGGIRIYRDGFRVLPYGELRDDWLRLAYDSSRRSLLVPASNNNFFGQVELSSSVNSLLEETSSREGLIENEAFSELVAFVRGSLEWGVNRIAAARERKIKASQKGFKSRGRKASDEVRGLLETIKQATLPAGGPSDAVSLPTAALEMVVDKVERVVEKLEEEKEQNDKAHLHYEEMLRILASLGASIAVFSHEIRGALNGFSGALLRLQRLAEKHGIADEASAPLADASGSQGRLKDLASYVMSLVAHTANRDKTEVALQSEVQSFTNQFKQYLNTHEVEFEIAVTPSYLRTAPIHQSEIHSVLFNFLTNSIKAMLRANPEKRKIRISAEREGKFVRIGFQDTGDGVPEAIADRVFDPFFTTHQHGDDGLAGPGSGLGLKIVHDIASANGGDVRLAPPDAGYNCRFDFYVPVSSSQK